MYILTLIAFCMLVLIPLGVFPPVGVAATARNDSASVSMPKRSRYPDPQKHSWQAVAAQELGEFWLRWFVALLLAFPLCFLLDVPDDVPSALLLEQVKGLLLGFVCTLWVWPVTRQFDLLGHSTECAWMDSPAYDELEARRMLRDRKHADHFHALARKNNSTPVVEAVKALQARRGIGKVLGAIVRRRVHQLHKNWPA